MATSEGMTLYTYSRCDRRANEPRWHDDGIGDIFFESAEAAKVDLIDLRKSIVADAEETWVPMQLERIDTLPLTKDNLLALLNNGVGSVVKKYEVLEIVA